MKRSELSHPAENILHIARLYWNATLKYIHQHLCHFQENIVFVLKSNLQLIPFQKGVMSFSITRWIIWVTDCHTEDAHESFMKDSLKHLLPLLFSCGAGRNQICAALS